MLKVACSVGQEIQNYEGRQRFFLRLVTPKNASYFDWLRAFADKIAESQCVGFDRVMTVFTAGFTDNKNFPAFIVCHIDVATRVWTVAQRCEKSWAVPDHHQIRRATTTRDPMRAVQAFAQPGRDALSRRTRPKRPPFMKTAIHKMGFEIRPVPSALAINANMMGDGTAVTGASLPFRPYRCNAP